MLFIQETSGFSLGRGGGPYYNPSPPPFSAMKILSWNCRGLGHPNVFMVLKNLIKLHNQSCVFLCERKGGKKRLEMICRKLGCHNYDIVEAKGKAGGLCLIWSEDINLVVSWKFDRFFCGEIIREGGKPIHNIIACHGTFTIVKR